MRTVLGSHFLTILRFSSSSVVLCGFFSACYRWNWGDLLIFGSVDVKMVVVLFGVESETQQLYLVRLRFEDIRGFGSPSWCVAGGLLSVLLFAFIARD
ncbi:hypothetical protein Bca101_067343 [Brassica carinata]